MLSILKILVITYLIVFASVSSAQNSQPTEVEYDMQRIDVRYRIYKTRNIWNTLLLDTQTGQVWQVQIGLKNEDRMRIPLNKEILASSGAKPGRFTLYSSRNIYQFILLDQENGRTWQIQWSTENTNGIWPLEEKKESSEWKR